MATFPATIAAPPAVVPPYRAPPILPENMDQAMRLADVMSTGRLVPAHLQKSPSDCLAVILQAVRWQADPFAVAQCTSVISGKLMFEGKLTMAVINTSGRIKGRLEFEYAGEGDDRSVECSGWLIGEPAPVSVTVRLKDARTNNRIWLSQPDQQLAYHSARVWGRRYAPELMLGIYGAEEMPESAPVEQRQEHEQPRLTPPAAGPRATPIIELQTPGGGTVGFPKTKHGVAELLKYAAQADPGVVLLNLGLMDQIAERMPEHAEKVAEIRAIAAKALTPADQWPGQDAGAESPESDPESHRRAVIRDGAMPEEDDSTDA
jgi:hypothetical protein